MGKTENIQKRLHEYDLCNNAYALLQRLPQSNAFEIEHCKVIHFIVLLTSKITKKLNKENNGQRQRCKRHFVDVSVTAVTIISTFITELQ